MKIIDDEDLVNHFIKINEEIVYLFDYKKDDAFPYKCLNFKNEKVLIANRNIMTGEILTDLSDIQEKSRQLAMKIVFERL